MKKIKQLFCNHIRITKFEARIGEECECGKCGKEIFASGHTTPPKPMCRCITKDILKIKK